MLLHLRISFVLFLIKLFIRKKFIDSHAVVWNDTQDLYTVYPVCPSDNILQNWSTISQPDTHIDKVKIQISFITTGIPYIVLISHSWPLGMNKFLWGQVCSFFLGKFLGLEWIDYMVNMCFTKVLVFGFSKWLYHFAFLSAICKSSKAPYPCKHLALSIFLNL